MAFILSDRVKETTTTTGTGTVTLGGTIDASKTFSAAIGDGNSTYYCIESPDGNFEVGVGTYTSSSNTLSRDTVISSSNSGSKISLVGVSNVFCTQPGPKAVFINTVGLVSGVNGSFQGFSFPDGTIQYTSATSGNAPTTMQRQNEGILFNYFVNNAYDETVSLHLENEQFPRFKLGLRDSPDGNSAPTYGYLFGEQGYAGGVADSTSEFFIANNNGFWIKHASQNIANFAQDDGIVFQNVAAASPVFTVKGNAAQATDLQRWSDNSSTTLAKVTKEGHISGVQLDTPTISFADGTTQTTAGYTGTGDINVNQYIYHEGDSNTYIRFRGDQLDFVTGGRTMLTLDEASNDKVIVNDGGNDVDFQVEGQNDANLIRTDAANDRVGIGTSSPSYLLDVAGSGSFEGIRFSDGTTQATSFAADVATASGALRADITTNTAAIPASGYAISGALQSQIDSLGGASISYVDAATASGVANSGFLSEELHEISGVGGLIANKSNWDTAYGWGDHSSAGYLTSQTSHADVVVDGDFSSQGLMKRGFSGGSYSIVTDNSSNWNTAYSWGDHSTQSYTNLSYVSGIVANSGYAISGALQSQIDGLSVGSDSFTSESGVAHSGFFSEELHNISGVGGLIANKSNWDTAYGWGDHSTAGYLTSYTETNNLSSAVTWANVPNANITESSVTQHQAALSITESQISDFGSYLTSQTSHADVVVDGDFSSEGLMKRGGSAGSYSIVTDNSSNWNTAYSWGDHSTQSYTNLTFVSGIVADSGHALQSQIDNLNHDTLTGFVANEHIDWTADQGGTNIHTGNYDNTTYTAGSGIELQGTEFNVAISGDNILATNTPTNNYVPSYVNGQITWVANAGGGGGAGDITGVDLTGGVGISIDSETNTESGAYSSTITCNLEGTELASTGETGTSKFLRVDGDGTCSWQVPPDTDTTYTKASFDLDHLFVLVGASADTDENLGTFTGSTISDSRTIKQALQDLETELETKTTNTGDITGVDLTGGTGISIDSETNTASGSYSSTITCNLEGTELASTGETGTAKFLRVDGDGTCSWQVPPDTDTTYAKASFDLDHLFVLVGASADTDENLGTFTGSTISDSRTIKQALQDLETELETKTSNTGDITGVDLTGGVGISIDSETNTGSGSYSSTITCNLEGTELASTGETGTSKFLRVDGDGTCSWQVPPDTNTTYVKADFDLDHLFTLVGASADSDEHLGTFTGSTISDNQTIKAAIQALETAVETKGAGDITGVDLTGGTGISIDSETNTGSGAYSSTITCNLEGTELASTGETGTAKFLRVDGDGTCSWQVPPDTDTTYTKASFDIDHLFTLVGASDDTDENLGTFTGSTISDSRTIKQALQDLETELETKGVGDMTGVDLTGGTGISIDSETNTGSGAYSSTITCNLEGTELASTGETGTAKFLRVDGDGTCSWQVPPDTNTTYAKADFDLDHLFTLVGASANTDENLGTFTGSTISDSRTIKQALQDLETELETKTSNTGDITGVDLTGGTGISIDSETNTGSGAYSSTITCNLEGTELASTGETGTTKFLRVDGDGTCSWQVPPDTNTTYTGGTNLTLDGTTFNVDDAFLKNNADDTTSGTVTMANLIVGDGGDVGSASATDAISIASTGKITYGYGSVPKTVVGGTSGDVDLNANLSNYFTIAAAGTLNILIQNAEAGQRILLRIVTGGHGANITWDGTMTLTWPGGTAPTFTTNGTDVIGLLCTAANTFDGFIIGQNIS